MLAAKDQYVNIHAHRLASYSYEWVLTNLELAKTSEADLNLNACYSVGIHPWELEALDIETAYIKMEEVLTKLPAIAIGETGIDKTIDTSLDLQMKVFEHHVELAEDFRLPVIIHAVRATQELHYFTKVHTTKVPLIIHGFRGSPQQAEDLVRSGFYLSIGAALLQSEKLKQAVKIVPVDRLFIETDESNISIKDLYQNMAHLHKISVNTLQQHMVEKVNRLFKNRINENKG